MVMAIIVETFAVIAAISLAIDKTAYFWISFTFLAAKGLMGVFAIASLVTLKVSEEFKDMETEVLASAAIRAVTNFVFPFVLLAKDRRRGGLQTMT